MTTDTNKLFAPEIKPGAGPIVLAFSGGLDTCAILLWLKEKYQCEIIAYCAELGEGDDPGAIEARAMELGAKKFICEDLQAEFLTKYAWVMAQAGATYQKDYLLGTAIARPLIAKRMAEIALDHGAQAISHGATGKGNDQLRFEKTWSYLAPELAIIAPWKTWDYTGREDLLQYLEQKGFTYDFPNKTFSIDENLWHVSYEGGPLESLAANGAATLPQLAPKIAESSLVKITFASGTPDQIVVSAPGASPQSYSCQQDPVAAFKALNEIGAGYAIGVADLVEERVNGIKSRGVYATPGGTLLYQALDALKQMNWDHGTGKLAQTLATEFGEIIYQGDWFGPARPAVVAFFKEAAKTLTGTIELTLYPRAAVVASRSSELTLYDEATVSFAHDEHGINHAAAGYSQTLNYKCKAAGLQLKKLSTH